MKPSLRALLIGSAALSIPQLASATPTPPAATLLVGFHQFDATANSESPHSIDTTAGFTGSAFKPTNSVTPGGSKDATWGNDSALTPAPGVGDGYLVDNSSKTGTAGLIHIRVDYNGSDSWALKSLLFDAANASSGRSATISAIVTNDDSTTTVISLGTQALKQITPTGLAAGAGVPANNFGSYILDLTSFNLIMNAVGDGSGAATIDFRFDVGNSINTGYLDNVALTANLIPVPEPGSLLALGCVIGSGAFLRMRRRS